MLHDVLLHSGHEYCSGAMQNHQKMRRTSHTVAASHIYGCSLPRIRLQPRMRAVAGPAVGVAVPAVVEHQLRLHVLRHTALPSHTRSAGGDLPRRRPAPAPAPYPHPLCTRSAPALHPYCAPPTARLTAPRELAPCCRHLPCARSAPALGPHCAHTAPSLRPSQHLPTRELAPPLLPTQAYDAAAFDRWGEVLAARAVLLASIC